MSDFDKYCDCGNLLGDLNQCCFCDSDTTTNSTSKTCEQLAECSDCGADFEPQDSRFPFTCQDCASNPYL